MCMQRKLRVCFENLHAYFENCANLGYKASSCHSKNGNLGRLRNKNSSQGRSKSNSGVCRRVFKVAHKFDQVDHANINIETKKD